MKKLIKLIFLSTFIFMPSSCSDDNHEVENKNDIPNSDNNTTITLKVLEVNEGWESLSDSTGFVSSGAEVTMYKNDKKTIVKSSKTDSKGIATFSLSPDAEYYFTVHKDSLSDLSGGLIITGIFTTQEEINNYPQYPEDYPKGLGDLKFYDLNADGLINNLDKVSMRSLNLNSGITKVYIADKSIVRPISVDSITITDEMMRHIESDHLAVYNLYLNIDNNYSRLSDRETFTPSSPLVENYWTSLYRLNRVLTNMLLMIKEQSSKDQQAKAALLRKYRADVYYYLAISFGNPVLVTPTDISSTDISRAYKQETKDGIFNFILEEYAKVWEKLPTKEQEQVSFIRAQIDMYHNKYGDAINNINLISSEPTWADLLRAECLLVSNNLADALSSTNKVLKANNKSVLPVNTGEEALKQTIHILYDLFPDKGVKYPNIIRWGENSTWGKYALFPIPQREIDLSPNIIVQNEGW